MNRVYELLSTVRLHRSRSYDPRDDLPWILALRDPEILDWKRDLSTNEICTIARQQEKLPVAIAPYLYLGDRECARDLEQLGKEGITHIVVNVAGRAGANLDIDYGEIEVLRREAKDEEGYPILARHLNETREFIATARKSNPEARILIHCVAGVNRSAMLVASEIMLSQNKPVVETVALLRRRRGNFCLMNESFQTQLVAYARTMNLLDAESDIPTEPWQSPICRTPSAESGKLAPPLLQLRILKRKATSSDRDELSCC
eukprot:gene20773-24901_t